jgi:hypothetical protein
VITWLRGWTETLNIMVFHRDLYRELTKPLDLADYGEVQPPEVSE